MYLIAEKTAVFLYRVADFEDPSQDRCPKLRDIDKLVVTKATLKDAR
jgi:hypothetical protein